MSYRSYYRENLDSLDKKGEHFTDIANYNFENTYSGELDIEDFNTYTPNKERIKKQVEAINLKNEIENKKENERKMNKYKDFTLEELRRMKLISNSDGRPLDRLTDEKWQQEFSIRKLFVTPYSGKSNVKRMRMSILDNREDVTTWQEYCRFINDILTNIESGQVDYCYFVYQILDLLKFHYNDLRTKYRDGYWEVWLEGSND